MTFVNAEDHLVNYPAAALAVMVFLGAGLYFILRAPQLAQSWSDGYDAMPEILKKFPPKRFYSWGYSPLNYRIMGVTFLIISAFVVVLMILGPPAT